MPVVKKRNLQTETRLLLEGDEPIELPPAEIEDRHVLVQFEQFKPFIGELLEELRMARRRTGSRNERWIHFRNSR